MRAALIALVVFVCALCARVQATSDSTPDIIYLCDATSNRFGCDPQAWTNGDRLKCQNKTQIMNWASRTVRSNCYSLVAGDESNPVGAYEPGQLLPIHLRVTCYGMLFRGLLLYAVNGNEEKVGDWEITAAEPAEFKRPWPETDHSCFGSLMHASAEYKPYHSVLYFKAPPVGTGRITFRCLIKYGNANTGAFYWPLNDLVLNEAGASPPVVTIFKMSQPGQSCTDLCKTHEGYSCDPAALSTIQDPSGFTREFSSEAVCVLPVLSGCGSQAATYDSTNQYCYYPSSDCAAQNRTPSAISCDTQIPDTSRFCACTNEELMESSANTFRGISGLFVMAMFLVSPRSALLLLAILGLSSAHNWINTPSRSNGASTYQPFKPATTDMPHVQVGRGQAFQVEWMTAHGGFTYFAIVHSKNQHYMQQINEKLLNDYIALAPANAKTDATTGIYQRLHRKDNRTLDNDFPASSTTATRFDFFLRFVNASDPLFISRPVGLRGRVGSVSNPTDASNIYLLQYKPADLAQDMRVSYESVKYPYLEAVYKFKHSALQPIRPDTANFWIPGFGGNGRYLVQYVWSGYRDVIDVDLMPSSVVNIYGVAPNATRWRRIDHCLFDNPRAIYGVSEVVTDSSWCLRKCVSASSNCWGVNVVPLVAPSTAYRFNQPPDQAWFYPSLYGTDIYVPWNWTAFNTVKDRLLANAAPNKYICYAVQPADFTDTTDEYTISKDPDDPVFYSTCYYRYRGNLFAGYPDETAPSTELGPWRFNDKCIDCQSQSRNLFSSAVPSWNVVNRCINCDDEPRPSNPPVFPRGILVERGVRCDGQGGAWSQYRHHNCSSNSTCVMQLIPLGRGSSDSLTLEECRSLAGSNSNCSNTFYWAFNSSIQRCYCYNKDPCCSSCSRRTDAVVETYEISTNPDPTCERGVLSTDGKSCCNASCGAGKCGTSASNSLLQSGFCCATCITRPCSEFGPPCRVSP